MIGNSAPAPRFSAAFLRDAGIGATANAQTLALVGGRVYSSPDATPIGGRGSGFRRRHHRGRQSQRSPETRGCPGHRLHRKDVVAGFWNSHVHFTEAAWENAAGAPAASLEEHMQAMLTRWGFTTVWDLGSDPRNSYRCAAASTQAKSPGPTSCFAGNMFPKGGHPVYLPREVQLPEVATRTKPPNGARLILGMGHDGIKLFTGAFMGDKPVVNMDAAVAKAAVDVAHAAGQAGVRPSAEQDGCGHGDRGRRGRAGPHRPGEPGDIPEQLARFKSQGTALIPTLSLLHNRRSAAAVSPGWLLRPSISSRHFRTTAASFCLGPTSASPRIYDTSLEYELMHRALSERQVLASLTTNPAAYFKVAKKGRVEKGI